MKIEKDNTIHIKREWNETRGDQFDYWGNSMWYFETNKNGTVQRQIEEYSIGIRLRYDSEYNSDNFGMLSNIDLELTDKEFKQISETEFEGKWLKRNPSLCQTIDDDKMTIKELEKNEIYLPISDSLYDEIWSADFIKKLKHLPMRFGPNQDFEETMILNEGLTSAIQIFESAKLDLSKTVSEELDFVMKFIKDAEINGKAIQFRL